MCVVFFVADRAEGHLIFRRDFGHVTTLDPELLGLMRVGFCWMGTGPRRPLTSRKIWGERCSGTNFADALLERHFETLKKRRGQIEWKHGLARPNWSQQSRLNLFLVRDPFTWAQSLYKNPWHLPQRLRNRSFADFIREEWVGVFYDQGKFTPERPADRHPVERRRFRDVWEMRSVKLRHALVASSEIPNGVFVRYEDVSVDPEAFLSQIADRFGLPPLNYQPITDYKGESRRSYEATTYEAMEEADRAHILGRLDPSLERFFGYLPGG